jgi:RNA-directed DNA polymerase
MQNREERPVVSTRPGRQLELPFDTVDRQRESSSEPHGQSCTATADTPALEDPQQGLMELIVDQDNLDRAWRQVRANRGAAGPDGMTIAEFPDWCRVHWPTIRQQLLDGTYRPQPVRRVTIPKSDGGKRMLGIPNVLDRVIQQAIGQVLTPIFDPGFSATNAARRCPVSAFDRTAPHTEPSSRYSRRSDKAIDMLWTWTCRSSSTACNTMC